MTEAGLTAKDIVIGRPMLHKVIAEYTREAGVRELERLIAQLARKVYSIEIIEELAQQAKVRLKGCANVELRNANGYHGWSEHAPFDRVMVTAAPDLIPPPLLHQLKAGGRMVIPAGLPDAQQLVLVEKQRDGRLTMKEILQVRFSQLEGGEGGHPDRGSAPRRVS